MYGSTALVDLGRFFSFLIYTQSVGLLGRGISTSQCRYLHTEQRKYKINAHRHPSMPQVGFEPTIPVFERAKTVHVFVRPRGHCDRPSTLYKTEIELYQNYKKFAEHEGKWCLPRSVYLVVICIFRVPQCVYMLNIQGVSQSVYRTWADDSVGDTE
jgi:hypothetical protein